MTKLPGSLGVLDWSKWAYGLVSAVIGGGAGAVTAGFSASMVVPGLKLSQALSIMGITFAVSGALSGLAFLHQQPLPDVTSKESSSVTVAPTGAVTATKTTETRTVQKPQ